MAFTDIDRQLLDRCVSQEAGAWRDFVDRFIGLFVHVINHVAHARSVQLSPEDLDDLCAEVFLTLSANDFSVLRGFRGSSSLATYLTVVARRVVVREIAKRRKAEVLGHVQAHQSSLINARTNHSEHQRIEDKEEVRLLLNGLPARDAEVVRQFHLEGRTYREISEGLGIPENSVGPHLNTRPRTDAARFGDLERVSDSCSGFRAV